MSSWVAHYGQDGFDVLLLVMFLVASVGWWVQARGRDRAEAEADEAWDGGYRDGYTDGLAARPDPEPEPEWQQQDTFYQPPMPEPEPSDWLERALAEFMTWDQQHETERIEWHERVGIPFEDELVPA